MGEYLSGNRWQEASVAEQLLYGHSIAILCKLGAMSCEAPGAGSCEETSISTFTSTSISNYCIVTTAKRRYFYEVFVMQMVDPRGHLGVSILFVCRKVNTTPSFSSSFYDYPHTTK